eukprot:jgi/Galph1/3377/GphlegSOOS_G2014.1
MKYYYYYVLHGFVLSVVRDAGIIYLTQLSEKRIGPCGKGMSRPPPLKATDRVQKQTTHQPRHFKDDQLYSITEDTVSSGKECRHSSVDVLDANHNSEYSKEEFSPLHWSGFFDVKAKILLPYVKEKGFQVYAVGSVGERIKQLASSQVTEMEEAHTETEGSSREGAESEQQALLLLFHGGGDSSLSFGWFVKYIKEKLSSPSSLSILAFDARGHGDTFVDDEGDLSSERQVEDALHLLETIYGAVQFPPLILTGHSMGGAIAVRVAVSGRIPRLLGLVVIDVVEGTALASLSHMQSMQAILQKRPESFASIEDAVRYTLESGQIRFKESSRLSLPSQLIWDAKDKRYHWRTNLEASQCYWKGWFENLSNLFLSVKAPKLLMLAGQDRLDKALTIAQMQGQFQLNVIRDTGHNLHDDRPETAAQIMVDFMRRHSMIN